MGKIKAEIYEHFHPDERPFVDRVDDWLRMASDRHVVKLTDFLDPRQCEIVDGLTRMHDDLAVTFDGGYDAAERKRACIAPAYRLYDSEALDIALLEITSDDNRFAELDHSDVLGAMTGLGIKRDKLGDIHLHPGFCHVLVCADMADYIRLHLHEVRKAAVMTSVRELDRLHPVEVEFDERTITVSSLRLDAVVSDLIRMSRAKTLPLIRAGQCRVNWKPEENPACLLQEDDVVSVRRHGRYKLLKVEGVTRKGNTVVRVGKFV